MKQTFSSLDTNIRISRTLPELVEGRAGNPYIQNCHYKVAYLFAILLLLGLTGCRRDGPTVPSSTETVAPTLVVPTMVAPPTSVQNLTGQLLKSDGPAIYRLMEDGTLRHIPTWADFVALGYEGSEIITLSDAELARYMLGPPLTVSSTDLLSGEVPNPLSSAHSFSLDKEGNTLWIGTGFNGVAACPWADEQAPDLTYIVTQLSWKECQIHTTFTGGLLDNSTQGLLVDLDGSAWVLSQRGVSHFTNGEWNANPLAEGVTHQGALSITLTADGDAWVGGDGYIAKRKAKERWEVYTALEQPILDDLFRAVRSSDDDGEVIFTGGKRELRFDGNQWRASTIDGTNFVVFQPNPPPPPETMPPPRSFPNPQTNYHAWLQTWPRPANDSGRCMHFVQTSWLDENDAQRHIDRLTGLGARWTVVPYANHFQLRRLAPLFAAAEITVIWRPFIRPYESYAWWEEDVAYLRFHGYAPYMQLYNEPSLAQEWDAPNREDDLAIDQNLYLANLVPAARAVYNAGGYVGLQLLDLEWTRTTLSHFKDSALSDTFNRLFFVPHPYGLNHPPGYDEDESSVLGFTAFADVFADEIGFVPMMIAGEGGWRPNEQQDDRYPPVSYENHRDYHVEVFEWFRSGELSNGEPLPDYLFAFCPWLIADPVDSAGWYDSQSGDSLPTIEAVQGLPPFVRRFSWE